MIKYICDKCKKDMTDADFAIRFGISSEEITGKIIGLIAEGKRKQEVN